MEVITINWLELLVGLFIGAILAMLLTRMYFIKGLDEKSKKLDESRKKTEEEALELIGEAVKTGEDKKRELLLLAKEEVHKTRLELERDVREKRQEISRERARLEQKEEQLDRRTQSLEDRSRNNDDREEQLNEREEEIQMLDARKTAELERIAGLTISDARELVLEDAEREYRHDMAVLYRRIEEESKTKADDRAKEIVVSSIQRYASDYVSDASVSVVVLPNEEMKGRIIGREGRNIRTLETLTGIDLIIDDTPEAVILSGFDPIRREIARIALEKLVADGRIHPARIEEMVEKARREVEAVIREEGEQATFEANVHGLHPELIKLLGRLRFRTSYGQNVLKHSVEVAHLAAIMAAEIGADEKLARRAGLLHDIGKAVDHEVEGTHVQIGVDLLRRYKESPDVIHAMECHHGDCEPRSVEAVLVAAADSISAARPGARRETLESYIKRLERLEAIADSFEGVEKAYAIQAGREIRIMVKPERVDDAGSIWMAREIAKRIESELEYPGQIKVTVIRETRATEYAK